MSEVIYRESILWDIAGIAAVGTQFLGPIFALAISVIWIMRFRSLASGTCVMGGILMCGAAITRNFNPDKGDFVYIGWLHPYKTDNPFLVFVHLYGANIGLFLFALALFIYFVKNSRHA